ncbi:hypothetical protein NDU88_011938 [Pleurodeles waltl]|uniref:Uncharacterized protein n=1 Tax=Pleurodeles waltl TaxID=8319 RepID=A0AAV7S388_PLEWA|nr:hypothetical protein NDU88_011938 [Pleurodeles waltl]
MADGGRGFGIDRCGASALWGSGAALLRGERGQAAPLSEGRGGLGRDWLRRRLLGGLTPPETRPLGIEGNTGLVAGREASCGCPDPGI